MKINILILMISCFISFEAAGCSFVFDPDNPPPPRGYDYLLKDVWSEVEKKDIVFRGKFIDVPDSGAVEIEVLEIFKNHKNLKRKFKFRAATSCDGIITPVLGQERIFFGNMYKSTVNFFVDDYTIPESSRYFSKVLKVLRGKNT